MLSRTSGLVVLSFVVASLAACTAPPAPPPDTTAADTAAINELRAAWERAYEAADATTLAGYYTEDAVVMIPEQATVRGRSAIQAMHQAEFDQMTGQTDIRSDGMEVSGSLAWDSGEFTNTLTPKAGGEAMTVQGRYLVVLKRGPDGTWRLVRQMSNLPTARPAPGGGGS